MFKRKAAKGGVYDWSANHEAHAIAGHPHRVEEGVKHLGITRGGVGTALGISVASGVGTYQINRKLAKVQGDIVPTPSPTTAPVGTGAAVANGTKVIHRKLTGKGGKD